jgi:DNA-binding beta-propeller fold protein YncE
MSRLGKLLSILAICQIPVAVAFAADPLPATQPIQRLATIQVPGNPLVQFDIGWVDPVTETYYLADRSNSGLDIFDAAQGTFLGRVTGFVGFDPAKGTSLSGPDGVTAVGDDEVWVGDGDSTVKVIDLNSNTIIDTISTSGTHRVDEMAYDPRDHILAVANNADTPPFVTLISTKRNDRHIVARIPFTGATNGVEQPAWNSLTGLFYISVPQVGSNPASGAVAVIDPKTASYIGAFPVDQCQPAGLTVGPHNHLLVGCSADVTTGFQPKALVLDARTGRVVATIKDFGGADEVWFNPGDRNYYLADRNNPGNPVLGVINSETNDAVAALTTSTGAHSVAADPINNHVFVPLPPNPADSACLHGCIGVFGVPEPDEVASE